MRKLFYNNRFCIALVHLFILGIVFFSCPVLGQVTPKKNLTEQDYHLWSTMEIQTVSAKGDWVSYHLAYESGNDTLAVRNKEATKNHAFAKGYDGKFAKDSWFACMLPEKVLAVVHLKTGLTRQIKGVTQYAFSNDGKTLISLNDSNQLTIGIPDGSATEEFTGVSGFVLNPAGSGMIYTVSGEQSSLHYYSFSGKGNVQKLATDGAATFENIVWQGKGASFAFVKNYKDTLDVRHGKNLHLYRLSENKLYSFDTNLLPTIPKTSTIESPIWTHFRISDDGQRVFFYITEGITDNEKPLVQVWNGNDAWTYSQVQLSGRFDKASKCAVWWPDSERFLQLTTTEQPKLMLNGDQKYAITHNPMGEKPQFNYVYNSDFYITDLASGKRTLLLENQIGDMTEITPSFGGKYIAYFKDKQWWVYDIANNRHRSISSNMNEVASDEFFDHAGHKPAFGIAGWTKDDVAIILYDEYDLWSINLKDLQTKRLTRGREHQIAYRLSYPVGQIDRLMNFDGFTFPQLDLENEIYLKAYGKLTKQSGYYIWDRVEKPLVFKDKSVTQLGFSNESQTYYYVEQDFDAPPCIIAIGKLKSPSKVVVQSNSQHTAYYWGKSQLISYSNSKNKKLQGALYYPANYDPAKKYPMVVYIYQKFSKLVHDYVNPTIHNIQGINTSNLNSQGYFVLFPDISFEMDDVGIIAADCVVSATKAVIGMGLIQSNKIALTGHSFGGYEADFIATQTDIFATVISGAGISDLVSHALSIGWNNGRPELWRYEDSQWRMSKSLYEDMENYLRNSPVMNAQNIKVPLLTWTGELDRQVHYYQSIGFYNALRRLGKKQIMLIYPDNGHIISQPKSQEDFTRRYEQWLATYLKDAAAPDWIVKGMQ
jgi:dipeptidyl aminopeptidase/acylaminoacyl peptidase